MKLYDRICRYGVVVNTDVVDPKDQRRVGDNMDRVRLLVRRCIPVYGDPLTPMVWDQVNRWFDGAEKPLLSIFDGVDTPCRPPFDLMFLEWPYTDAVGRHGVLVETFDNPDDLWPSDRWRIDPDPTAAVFVRFTMLTWEPWVARDSGRLGAFGPMGHCMVALDQSGMLVPITTFEGVAMPIDIRFVLPEDSGQEEPIRWMVYLSFQALTMLRLMNCKNIVLTEKPPEYASRQERRADERAGHPRSRFYTLQIDPTKAQVRRLAEPSGNKRDLALHVVRGHFATYTAERPLFGKYTGTYWVPAHVRGDPDVGLVGKDYQVLPGTTQNKALGRAQ